MKTSLKRLLSVLLAVLLLLSCMGVSFAAGKKDSKTEKTPIVLIPGFGQSETAVYDDDGTYLGNINSFTLPGLDNVGAIVKKVLLPVLASATTKMDIGLTEAAEGVLDDIFKPYALNNDGTPVYNKVVDYYGEAYSNLPPEAQQIVQHHISIHGLEDYDDVRYYYTYDTFGSIKEAGDGLRAYIHDVVLKQTGAKQVILVPVSQGATVLTQYLADYPEDYPLFKKIICMIPAFDGAQILGDIMTDNVMIYDVNYDHETVLPQLLEGDLGYQISLALRFALSERQLKKVLAAALEKARQTLVVKSTAMWALVPAADYAKVKEHFLGDGQHDKIYAECEAYDAARKALPATLHKLQKNGVSIQIVACYGTGNTFPYLFGSGNLNSDDLLTPASSTLGATFANLGETLGDDYVCKGTHCKNKAHNHLSPDRMIDASTCEFPENTWFFKNVKHREANLRNDLKDYAAQIILNDDIKDIYTYPGYEGQQFIDPYDAIAHTIDGTGVSGKTIHYYYDEDWHFLFSEPAEEPETVTFWKVLATFTNKMFRAFEKLNIFA